jgi:hypothetical protein
MSRQIDPELTRLLDIVLEPSRGYMDISEETADPNTFYIVEYHGSDYDKIAEFSIKYIDFAYALIYHECGY